MRQCRVPAKEPLLGQRLVVALGRVEHQLDDALSVATYGHESPDIHSQPPGDRRPHLLGVEFLALDGGRLHHIDRQRVVGSFLTLAQPILVFNGDGVDDSVDLSLTLVPSAPAAATLGLAILGIASLRPIPFRVSSGAWPRIDR